MRLRLLIWFFAIAAIVAIPICAEYYFLALGESGTLGIADAIMIPISGSYMMAVILAPVVAIVTLIGTLRLKPSLDVLVWKKEQPIRSVLATVIFGSIAALAIFSGVEPFWRGWPAYEHYWQPMNLAWFLWALSMRSVFIDKMPAN